MVFRFVCIVVRPQPGLQARTGGWVAAAVLLASLLSTLHHFLEFRVETVTAPLPFTGHESVKVGSDGYIRFSWPVVVPTTLRNNRTYSKVSSTITVLLYLSTTALLAALNWAIYSRVRSVGMRSGSVLPSGIRNIRKERKQQEKKMAFLLVTVVFVFLICQSPRVVISIVEQFILHSNHNLSPKASLTLRITQSLSQLLLTANCSLNILIYIARDRKFWDAVLTTLKPQPVRTSLLLAPSTAPVQQVHSVA